jgi:hypothetical protein
MEEWIGGQRAMHDWMAKWRRAPKEEMESLAIVSSSSDSSTNLTVLRSLHPVRSPSIRTAN